MENWKLEPQQCAGNYQFSGLVYTSKQVQRELSPFLILRLYLRIRQMVLSHNGVDSLQAFTSPDGRTLYFIDQLDGNTVATGRFRPEDNYCKVIFEDEY